MNHPLLDSKHHELRERIRDFAEKVIKPEAEELDIKEEFSTELCYKMGEQGLFGINLSEEYGGKGLDTLSYIIAIEELARVDSSQAAIVASHNSLGISPIYNYGTEEQRKKYLPDLTTGKALWAFGLTEPNAGSDARGTETTAREENGSWVINGMKTFISNGSTPITRGVTIQAITAQEGKHKELSTIIVESDREGYRAEKLDDKMMWRAIETSKLTFKDVRVPRENLLGEQGAGARIMLKTLDSGRLSIAAMGLGLAQGAFEASMEYAKNRVQFGRPIGKFQINAFKLADMDLKIELARNTLYKACWLKDQGLDFAKEAAMSKLYCSEIAREIADEAVQIHGGYGLWKGPVERYYRDQRILQIGEGTSEILRLVISRKLGI